MYCAVLNQTLTAGLWRTRDSTTRAVTPATSIGQGCRNSGTDAMRGMNPTDVLTFANGRRDENESQTIPRIAKAASAFQNFDGNGVGTSHPTKTKRLTAATETTPTSA